MNIELLKAAGTKIRQAFDYVVIETASSFDDGGTDFVHRVTQSHLVDQSAPRSPLDYTVEEDVDGLAADNPDGFCSEDDDFDNDDAEEARYWKAQCHKLMDDVDTLEKRNRNLRYALDNALTAANYWYKNRKDCHYLTLTPATDAFMAYWNYKTPSAALYALTEHVGPYKWFGISIKRIFFGVSLPTKAG